MLAAAIWACISKETANLTKSRRNSHGFRVGSALTKPTDSLHYMILACEEFLANEIHHAENIFCL
jgi:hypothetical protein